MKFITPLFIGLTQANLQSNLILNKWQDSIGPELFQAFENSPEGHILAMDASGDDDFRKFSGQLSRIIKKIDEYSCWCYFNENHGSGKGKPIDGLDEACKTLHDGYECSMRDAETEGTTCIPWEVDYQAAGMLENDLGLACENSNPNNNCAARACAIEGAFISNMLSFFIGGGVIDDSQKHENGFSVENRCSTSGKKQQISDKSCCGKYPERFPFKTFGGERECCGTRTYNSNSLKCCDSLTSSVKFNC